MNLVPLTTIEGALDWYGFYPIFDGNTLTVSEGRIGRSDNPIIITNEGINGGWYLEKQKIVLKENDTRIDIMLDSHEGDIFFLVRSDSLFEIYAQRYELIVRLAWKEDDQWFVVIPERSLP